MKMLGRLIGWRWRHVVSLQLEYKLQDMWVGAYWMFTSYQRDIWICIVPMFPLHIMWLNGWRKLSQPTGGKENG